MVKFGSLRDYENAKKILDNSGVEYLEDLNTDLTKKLYHKENGEQILSIARLGNDQWIFLYNNKYWQERKA